MTAEEDRQRLLDELDKRAKKAETELLSAMSALCKKAGQNRRILIFNSASILSVLTLTIILLILYTYGH